MSTDFRKSDVFDKVGRPFCFWKIWRLKGITRFHYLALELESEANLHKPSLSKFFPAGQWFSVALIFLMKSKSYTYENVKLFYN